MLYMCLQFDTEEDLLEVQSAVSELIKNDHYVTKADLMVLVGEQPRYEDTKIGWDRNGVVIPPDDTTPRWVLEFPNPSRIISITTFKLVPIYESERSIYEYERSLYETKPKPPARVPTVCNCDDCRHNREKGSTT